jgi:hypothetical protein
MSVDANVRPMREVLSAKAKSHSHVWLVVVFALLRLAEVADWIYFKGGHGRTPLSDSFFGQQITGWLIIQALLTTGMLVGLWYRERWVRGLLKTWLFVELIVSGISMASAMYTGSAFPVELLCGAMLRSGVIIILSYVRDIRLFLSTYYMDTYTTSLPRRSSQLTVSPVYTGQGS